MDVTVTDVKAVEVLDSRARPTLAVTMTLDHATTARAGVPSGASTGSREAIERRDGDPRGFAGQGTLGAVGSVNGEIADALCGRTFADLAEVNNALIDLDGTETKSRLGANAIVGVSMATARAMATAAKSPSFHECTRYRHGDDDRSPSRDCRHGAVRSPRIERRRWRTTFS